MANPSPNMIGLKRFAPGNAGGPGNPHGKAQEKFRAALIKCVTPEEFRKLGRKMYDTAMSGDVGAAKLIMDRLAGKVPLPLEVTEVEKPDPEKAIATIRAILGYTPPSPN